MPHQFVFTMRRVSKYYDKRPVLENITLAFLPGAKIGVLGANGAGKSTLLRIMAGEERDIDGEAEPARGIKVGYVPQEPRLDPEKDVLGNVEEAVGDGAKESADAADEAAGEVKEAVGEAARESAP